MHESEFEDDNIYMSSLVSVIVPIFNCDKYLRESISSILTQTYSNLEIILIDNGSTDLSNAICKELEQQDDRIRFFEIASNKGVAGARNLGLKKAEGEYICFVDSDDCICSEMIEVLYNALVVENADIACSSYEHFVAMEKIDNQKEKIEVQTEILDKLSSLKSLFSMNEYRFVTWNKLYKKELFEGILFWNEKYYEDIWPIYEVFKKAQKVIYVKEKLYFYRNRAESLTRQPFSNPDYDLIEAITKVKEDCELLYPQLKREVVTMYTLYYLSFINRALLWNVDVANDEKHIQQYIRTHMQYYFCGAKQGLLRNMQILIFAVSIRLYRFVYLALRRK